VTHLTSTGRAAGLDRWFLRQIREIVEFEEELAGARN